MKCPNCGELIKEKKKMNFCGFCGANLKTGEKTFTQPEPEENFVPNSTPVQNLSDFNPGKSSAAVNTPPINPNFASPFEQMVKANAAPVEFGSFQTQITPPSFNAGISVPETPSFDLTKNPKEETPVSQSPIASFDPSSLSAFNPYNAPKQESAPVQKEKTVPVQIPAEEPKKPSISPEMVAETHDEVDKQLEALQNRRSSFEPSLNLSKNVKIRNASDDPDSVTYMEYTREANDEKVQNTPESLSFAPKADKEVSVNTSAVAEEPKKNISESADSILNFTTYKSSSELKNESETKQSEPVLSNGIIYPENADISAAILEAEKETEPEKTPDPTPEPTPAPEPIVIKEKVINYIGQDSKTAEQMLSFKGLKAEIEYVENEKEYGFVIEQDIPADTEVLPGSVVKLTVSAGTWTEWSENNMFASSSKYITETKTEYRKRSRTRTMDRRDTTDTSEYEDYTLTGTDCRYSDWETDQYYTSEAVPPGDTCEIIRMASGFKYAGWFNPANMTGMSYSSPDVANFFNTNLSNVKWTYEEVISSDNVKPDVKNWKLITDNMASTPAGDPMMSNIFFSAHVVDGKSYAMKYGSPETEWYIYKRRTLLETIYHFEKEIISDWSEWTEWSESEHTASDDCQVESRTLSRSRRKLPNEN